MGTEEGKRGSTLECQPLRLALLSLSATSDGTREGLESLQGGVCLTRGMKVLLRVGQSEWGGPGRTS